MQKAVQRSRIGNLYAHKNLRHDRCRIAIAQLKIRQILRTDFCGQPFYSSIDKLFYGRLQAAVNAENGYVCQTFQQIDNDALS